LAINGGWMNKFNNSKLTPNAKVLRKNMTKQERHLWYDFLKTLPITIHRQKVIGSYIVDFYCASKKIVIELDGSQHFENEGQEKDKLRDEYLKKSGIKVLRYSNLDIDRNFEGVCIDILKHISNEE
jgi:very-short-patch-repair endonuclease